MYKKYISIFVLTLLSISTAFAADPVEEIPCPEPDDHADPNWCNLPLDNWVYILVIAAVIFGAYKLYQKQKALTL